MPMTVQTGYDHTKLLLDPRVDGVEEWNQTACAWLNKFVYFNPQCPWNDEAKSEIGSELLASGLPLQNWVAKWKASPRLSQVWFKFYTGDEWNLQIGAYVGGKASATEYRVLDIPGQLLGVDAEGNLTHMVQPGPQPAKTMTLASPAPLPPATPQQVAKDVADANSSLQAAGANAAAALDRLRKAAALAGGVARTRAALDKLLKVAASAR